MAKKYEDAKILVVDDNNINLYTINQMLLAFGINSDCVPNGKACIKKVSKKQYDLIFMDHMMPEMDGIETFHQLKELPDFNTPVLVLTANEGEEYSKMYESEGFVDHVVKPVEKHVLEKILSKYLDKENDVNMSANTNQAVSEQTTVTSKAAEEESQNAEEGQNKETNKRDKLVAEGFTAIDDLLASGMSFDEFDMILSIFAEESLEKMADAEKHYNDENMREYAVIVHGLKNDAGMVSDMDLREHALKHEIESKAGNVEFVKAEWPILKKHWMETLDRINNYFASI